MYRIAFASAFLLLSTFTVASASILDDIAYNCPTGSHPATATEVPEMTAAGIPDAKVGMCWNSADKSVGQDTAKAKQDLEGMLCGNRSDQCSYSGTTYKSTISGLDPKFALCADKFMKQLRAQDSSACIRSAYRTSAHQMCACQNICGASSCPGKCAAPGGSYHQKGLAIDVNHPRVSKQQLWSIGSQSGLGNPNSLHSSDPDHMQVMNGGSTCSDIGYRPTDDDVFVPGPASRNPYFSYAPSPMPSLPPQQPFQSATPIQSSTQTTQSQSQTQPQICTPSFSCTNNTMYYQTTSCTNQVYQMCPYGCNGSSCNLSTSTAATTGTNISSVLTDNTNTNSNTNTDGTGTSTQLISDILNSYVNPTAVDIGTSTSLAFVLNPDTGEVQQLSQNTDGSTLQPASNTITSIQPTAGQQTFTSTDLSGSPGSFNGSVQTSALGQVLQTMKNALLWGLNALRGLVSGQTN